MSDSPFYGIADFRARAEQILSPEEQERRTAFKAFMATAPATIPCEEHPDQSRPISRERTWRQSYGDDFRAEYDDCPLCRLDKQNERLQRHGVPPVVLHCTLDNWLPTDDDQKAVLEAVRAYAERGRGFLVLLGPVGTGKTHLAVGVMRYFPSAFFVKQALLLRMLRETYSDKNADDPIEKAQKPDLLVLDEIGVSSGGKDEWPMLSEILSYRYEQLKATIITGNCPTSGLRELLGERLTDRLSECAAGVITIAGASHRAARRDQYVKTQAMPCDDRRWGEIAI